MELTCSLGTCAKPLLGTMVLLRDVDETSPIQWEPAYEVYYTMDEDMDLENQHKLIMLHPMCWTALFEEMMKQEAMTALIIIIGGVGDVRESLNIPYD